MKTPLILAGLAVVLFHLGSGLYYLVADRGESRRTVRALSWRVASSLGLILLVLIGILTGVVQPHGIAG